MRRLAVCLRWCACRHCRYGSREGAGCRQAGDREAGDGPRQAGGWQTVRCFVQGHAQRYWNEAPPGDDIDMSWSASLTGVELDPSGFGGNEIALYRVR
jgi:hypothetical protein